MRRPERLPASVWSVDRLVTLGALAALTLLAAGYTALGVGMDTSAIRMSGMAAVGGPMQDVAAVAFAPPEWTATYAVAVLLMWWVMMVAMMTPSAAPAILLYDALRSRLGRPRRLAVPAFAGGYLATWFGFSLCATVLQWGFEREGLLSPSMMVVSGYLLGGALLLAAGIWQLTPAKRACLRHCRNPAEVLAGRIGGGAWSAFRLGVRHGGWCVACCWGLMALLFVGGIMNLWWVLGLALVVLVEKLWARGEAFARAVGIGLVLWGVWLLAAAVGPS